LAERATDTNDPVAIAQATQFKTMTATQFLDNISGGQYSTDLKNMESDYGYVVDGSSATWNNIYNAIEMMEGINKMRASRGLGELKIDSTLFYMQVLEADINDSRTYRGHSDYCWSHSARNLAWGTGSPSGAVDMWMGEEAEYNKFIASNPDAKGLSTWDFYEKYSEESQKVGHFLNLTDSSLKYQGGGFGNANGNNAWAWGASTYQVGKSYTTAQFRQMADAVSTQDMYRLYNPNSGEHFYTASIAERNSIIAAGWKYEGIGWTAPRKSNTPVYRLYSGTDHHYTTSADERDNLVSLGWKYEGIGWCSDDAKGTPLYRQFNPNVNPSAPRNNSGSHNYTTSKAENDNLVSLGWRAEGIGWYGVKQ
jgi:hypothetical protein